MALDTPLRRPLQPGQVSPVVSKALSYKKAANASRFQFVWGILDIVIFLLILLEVKSQYIQLRVIGENDIFKYLIVGICASFALSALVNLAQALQTTVSGRPPVLSPKQKQLLGLRGSDSTVNFKEASLQSAPVAPIRSRFNLSALTSNITSTPTQQRSSPLSHSPHISPMTIGRQANVSVSSSPNTSYLPNQRRLSPPVQGSPAAVLGGTLDGSSYMDSSGGSPFLRHRRSPFRNSPLSPEDYMTDQKVLNTYLRSHYEKEQQRLQMLSLENSFSSSTGKWGFNKSSSFMDASQELLKNVYQIATPSPKSQSSIKDSKDDATKYAALEYWRKHSVTSEHLNEWTSRARKWIAATLLTQLVAEINKINTSLKRLGCPEIQVGESSVASLKQVISSRGSQIPNLTRLIPYLEVTTNQEYLVARLRKLASGGYMSEFKWNSGGEVKGRKWADDLPTDSEIIMHVFCVYMDSHLPADPRFPDGKTFTAKYFVKIPDKPKAIIDDRLVIHQSKSNPPHFRVIAKDTDYNIPQGRNNMFQSLLLFLHDVKMNKDGMLGIVNLGSSGINVLWILDDDWELARG